MTCGGGRVWFKVGDPAFRVSDDGVVYTLRHLSLAGKEKSVVVIYARDLQSKQVWKTRVHLHTGSQQVKLLQKQRAASLLTHSHFQHGLHEFVYFE